MLDRKFPLSVKSPHQHIEKSSQDCWNQCTACYNSAPPTGNSECRLWEAKCNAIQAQCPGGASGPPDKGKDISVPQTTIAIPAALGPTAGGSSMPTPTSFNAVAAEGGLTNTGVYTASFNGVAAEGSLVNPAAYSTIASAATSTTCITSMTTVFVTAFEVASLTSSHHHHHSKRFTA
jgi:hypothetical protein